DVISTIGNINRHIWRTTCYHCANQENLYIYDRAIYGVLSGDYENIIPVCRTWEDHIWAYYHSLIECQQDEYFSKHVRHMGVNEDDDLPINIKSTTPNKIFEMELVKQLKEELIDKRLSREDETAYFHFLRLATHLILYLRDLMLPTPDKESDHIIKLYTELLIEYRQNKLIALYASKLPRDTSIEIYALFLKDVMASYAERHKLFILAEQYGLNVIAIARKTFDLIFQEIETADKHGAVFDVRIISLKEPIKQTEIIQIRALEWLTFNKEQHREALKLGNTLCRRFLASGKMNVAGMIIMEMKNSKSPLSIIRYEKSEDGEIDTVYVEHQNYYNMIEYYNRYEIWWKTWKSKPKKSNLKDTDDWNKSIKEVTNSLDNLFHKFLESYVYDYIKESNNMMTDEDENRIRESERVMDIYIPNAVLRHHTALYETREIIPENLEKSFNLANIVVEESSDLSMHFVRSKKLQALLMALRDSYLEILRKNPKDISNVLYDEQKFN
ncbi:11397_t:CDS:10, partial [Rhizophagus irregularis]